MMNMDLFDEPVGPVDGELVGRVEDNGGGEADDDDDGHWDRSLKRRGSNVNSLFNRSSR